MDATAKSRLVTLSADGPMARLADAVRSILRDRNHGIVIVRSGKNAPDEIERFEEELGHRIGPLLYELGTGGRYTRRLTSTYTGSESKQPGVYRLHTDAPYHCPPPDWMALGKLEDSASGGGDSRLLHLDDWTELERFNTDRRAAEKVLWREPAIFSREELAHLNEQGVQTRVESLIFGGEPGSRTIRIGFRHHDQARLSAFAASETVQFLEEILSSLESAPQASSVRLDIGDVLFINNTFVLHGRSEFAFDQPFRRVVVRLRGYL